MNLLFQRERQRWNEKKLMCVFLVLLLVNLESLMHVMCVTNHHNTYHCFRITSILLSKSGDVELIPRRRR